MADMLGAATEIIQKQDEIHRLNGGKGAACGIVYCLTRQDTERTSDYLRERGIMSDYYHAGSTAAQRKAIQARWSAGCINVVCATSECVCHNTTSHIYMSKIPTHLHHHWCFFAFLSCLVAYGMGIDKAVRNFDDEVVYCFLVRIDGC